MPSLVGFPDAIEVVCGPSWLGVEPVGNPISPNDVIVLHRWDSEAYPLWSETGSNVASITNRLFYSPRIVGYTTFYAGNWYVLIAEDWNVFHDGGMAYLGTTDSYVYGSEVPDFTFKMVFNGGNYATSVWWGGVEYGFCLDNYEDYNGGIFLSMEAAEGEGESTWPDAPTGLTATTDGPSGINLSWTAPEDDGGEAISGYRIQRRSPGGSGDWDLLVADTESTATTYGDTGLSPNTNYEYRIAAINSEGVGDYSSPDDATTSATVPGAPTELTATSSGFDTINLAWTAPGNDGGEAISGYRIQRRSPGGSGDWTTLVPDTYSTYVTYQDTSLSGDTEYEYRVAAINSEGVGDYSNADDATTDPDIPEDTVPDAPNLHTVVADGHDAMDLAWDAPENDGGPSITGYRIERRSPGGSGSWTAIVTNTENTVTAYNDTGLAPNTSYEYRVAAINSEGVGEYSDPDNAMTETTTPGAPTGLSATADGTDTIDLSWTAPASNGGAFIAGYSIQRRSPGGSGDWSTLVADTESTGTTYENTGLDGGTEYEYRVAAINSVGTGPYSDPDDATTDELPSFNFHVAIRTNTVFGGGIV